MNNLRMPNDYLEFDGEELMSNFDNRINKETAKLIKNNKLFSGYAGWNFNGLVWWQNDKWNCEVWCYKMYRETFSANTLKEIMTNVSNKYGNE